MENYAKGGLGVVYPLSDRSTYQPLSGYGDDSDLPSHRPYWAHDDTEGLSPAWSPGKFSVSSPELSDFSTPRLPQGSHEQSILTTKFELTDLCRTSRVAQKLPFMQPHQ